MSDDAQINFNVPRSAKDAAKQRLDHGELSKILRQRVEEVAYGQEVSKHTRLERELDGLREEKDALRSKRREVDAEIEDVEQRITRVEEQLSQLDKQEDRYEAALEMLEETLLEGGRVFPEHGQVKRAATLGEKQAEDVIGDLQDRNPSVPEHAFSQGVGTDREWKGVGEAPR